MNYGILKQTFSVSAESIKLMLINFLLIELMLIIFYCNFVELLQLAMMKIFELLIMVQH